MVRDDQRAAVGGDVLDALLLDPEPVAVVEVERGSTSLKTRSERPQSSTSRDSSARREQLAQGARVLGRLAARAAAAAAGDVLARVEPGRSGARFLVTCAVVSGPPSSGLSRAQAPAIS